MNHLKRIFAFDIFIAITCDIDDLLLNLLGASLGYGLYRLTRRD